jgi:uncharacterized protein YbaR (Trm112 family)
VSRELAEGAPANEVPLELLACPCPAHGVLTRQGDELTCASCGRRYRYDGAIPVLLLDEAQEPSITKEQP